MSLKIHLRNAALAVACAAALYGIWKYYGERVQEQKSVKADLPTSRSGPEVVLSEGQAAGVKIVSVGYHEFAVERSAVGSIDFNEDATVQVFAPYQGRIVDLFHKIGDDVNKGQTLYTIDSPDLVQAASTLISTAGILELTTRSLARLRELAQTRAAAQKDYEQSISDQQAAEANHKAARDAVRLFGKTEQEMDRMVAERKVDSILVIPSPISGRITARNAAPGLFVQPGNAPAPYSVSNINNMWMIANVHESESPYFRLGQVVRARVLAHPDRVFEGRITTLGATIDPTTHRVLVRSEIPDPDHALRSGMFATFTIEVDKPRQALAVPVDGVVREGDGTMTVWVNTGARRFTPRTVKTGVRVGGMVEILEGVAQGEQVASEGALFLSNAAVMGPKS